MGQRREKVVKDWIVAVGCMSPLALPSDLHCCLTHTSHETQLRSYVVMQAAATVMVQQVHLTLSGSWSINMEQIEGRLIKAPLKYVHLCVVVFHKALRTAGITEVT